MSLDVCTMRKDIYFYLYIPLYIKTQTYTYTFFLHVPDKFEIQHFLMLTLASEIQLSNHANVMGLNNWN